MSALDPPYVVAGGGGRQHVDPGPTVDVVPAGASTHVVPVRAAVDVVTPRASVDVVLPLVPGDAVRALAPADLVPAPSTLDDVVTASPVDPVVAAEPQDDVVAGGSRSTSLPEVPLMVDPDVEQPSGGPVRSPPALAVAVSATKAVATAATVGLILRLIESVMSVLLELRGRPRGRAVGWMLVVDRAAGWSEWRHNGPTARPGTPGCRRAEHTPIGEGSVDGAHRVRPPLEGPPGFAVPAGAGQHPDQEPVGLLVVRVGGEQPHQQPV